MRKQFTIQWKSQTENGGFEILKFIIKDTNRASAIKQLKRKLDKNKDYTFGYLHHYEEEAI